ncbi:hypothetical protein DQ04_09991000, partial [Trypanosoma grayi]|uniref:hypothetical protein n=1 Tax=Trypanosoma grayi TaxID=71804 RepID=UPI0004F4A468
MLRRLHTRIVGLGSVCGLAPSPPAEVFLKSLPPPAELDHTKYLRFEREELERQQAPRTPTPFEAPEPFYDICCGAAGHKHVVLMTREGNLITFGENKYGQTAAPRQQQQQQQKVGDGNPLHTTTARRATNSDLAPLYVDLGGAFACGERAVACGSNYTIVYQPGGRRVIGFGNNHMGQLGVGHKNQVDREKGFAEWDPTASWWGRSGGSSSSVIRRITCGFNHAVLQLSCGSLFSFGSNTWGELGIGSTVS